MVLGIAILAMLSLVTPARAAERDVFSHIDSISCDYGSTHDIYDLCPFGGLPLACKRRIVKFFKWTENTKSVRPEIQREMAWLWTQQESYLDGQYDLSNQLCKQWVIYRAAVRNTWKLLYGYATELRR